ncbi:hypothetical protein FRC10_010280 [Ceratobasidium sp. 414]|nr:hypothetical protein FRC10_010280 [Ceratobasidium sp. 414]
MLQLRRLLDPQSRKFLPHCTTISQDIKRMHEVTQEGIATKLAVSNGYDYMGIIIFHLGKAQDESITLECFLLECLNFGGESHTGVALAHTVHNVLSKFKIQDRVWGIVCDNASNNTTMVDHMAEYGLKRLTGSDSHVYCMLHVINLTAQPDPADIANNDNDHAPSWTLAGDEEDPFMNIEVPKIKPGTPEAAESMQAGKVLYKVAKFVHKIWYSATAKLIFKEACAEKEQDPRLAIPCPLRLLKEDQKYLKALITLFHPLKIITEVLSCSGVPMLADVIVHFDTLDYEYTNICMDTKLPLYVRQGAECARSVLNKYYELTDNSILYRLAVLLHPSMHIHYLKLADWEDKWIETAVELAEATFDKFYKPSTPNTQAQAPGTSQFGYSSYMSRAPLLDHAENGEPMLRNPLSWWYSQRIAGNEWNTLTQMALDMLSTPATSVDVERAFSFASLIVSKRHHNLSAFTIQATASLGSYSKAGLMKGGCLVLPPRKGKPKA